MNSRVRIVKRNEAREPKQAVTDSKPTELVRNREMIAVVKSWIDEFKLRSRQQPQITLPLPNKA
jgi:hypothetical protein